MRRIPKCNPKTIDAEARRRSRLPVHNMERPKGRHAGAQDWTDIATNQLWQKTVLDQTGIAIPVNEPYKCWKCGMSWLTGFPPPVCSRCGAKSPLTDLETARKVYREKVKLKQ